MIRIAMWSGPRNISTALMRAWQARGDTLVTDEPLYAHYLLKTGAPHPGRDEIIAQGETDWRKAVARLTGETDREETRAEGTSRNGARERTMRGGAADACDAGQRGGTADTCDAGQRGGTGNREPPPGKYIHYQKHMAHHLFPEMEGPWLDRLRHAFLIRDPAEMATSLARVTGNPGPDDTGLPNQCALYRRIAQKTGRPAPVIDARDVLENPAGVLEKLCEALGVPWTSAMLSWEPGLRPEDGVWAPHWYDQVASSTGFRPPAPAKRDVPPALRTLVETCRPLYETLYRHRITA